MAFFLQRSLRVECRGSSLANHTQVVSDLVMPMHRHMRLVECFPLTSANAVPHQFFPLAVDDLNLHAVRLVPARERNSIRRWVRR